MSQPDALRLVNEYRPTMPHDVLNSWAQDAKVMIARLTAENEALRAAVAEAVAAERMACMVVCDQLQAPKSYTTDEQSLWDVATMACTEAIRALGTP